MGTTYWVEQGPNDYIGPTHACAGPNCPGIEHRATTPTRPNHRATALGTQPGGGTFCIVNTNNALVVMSTPRKPLSPFE